jgi:hypothetical protein
MRFDFLGFFAMLFTLATVAVIVSQRANTSAVLQALGSATGTAISAAVSPVTNTGTGNG